MPPTWPRSPPGRRLSKAVAPVTTWVAVHLTDQQADPQATRRPPACPGWRRTASAPRRPSQLPHGLLAEVSAGADGRGVRQPGRACPALRADHAGRQRRAVLGPAAGRRRPARAVLPAVLRLPVYLGAVVPAAGAAVLVGAGLALAVLLAAIASLVTRWVVLPVRHAAQAAQRLSAGHLARTHAGARRGRSRRAGHLVQRDGVQPAGQAPGAGGAVQGAAAVRLRRVARAAHPADDHQDGRRYALRGPGRARPGRPGRRSCCRARSSGSRPCSSTCSRSAGTTPARPRWTPSSSTSATWSAVRPMTPSSWPSAAAAGSSSGCPRPAASPRSTGAGWSGSCATSW